MIQSFRNIQSYLSALIGFPSILWLQIFYFCQQAWQVSSSLTVVGYLAGFTVIALIPCPKKIHGHFSLNATSLLTTLALFYGYQDIAYGLLLLSSWQMGVRLLTPWLLVITLFALETSWSTFGLLILYHIICITQHNPPRLTFHQSKWSKPLGKLVVDLITLFGLFAWSILTYLTMLMDVSNTLTLVALLPIVGGLLIAQSIPKPTEFFIYPGYIGLSMIACTIMQITMVYTYPLTFDHPTLNILFITLQAIQLCTLSWIFSLAMHLYQTLRRNQNTSLYDGGLLVGCMMVIMITVSLQNGLSLSHNLIYLAWFITGLMIITLLRYPAPCFKSFLQILVYHVFKVKVTGLHNLQGIKKPYIVIANHISYIEPPLLGGILPGRYMFPINPLSGEMLIVRLTEIFWDKLPMSPDQPMMLKPFIKGLRHGRNGIIFPEGQRNPHTQIGKVFPGVTLAINLTHAKLVPIYIEGSQHHVTSRYKSFFPKRLMPHIQVHIEAPITPNPKERLTETDIRNYLIQAKLKQPRPSSLKAMLLEVKKQVGYGHAIIYAAKKRLSLKSLLAETHAVKWDQATYYHCTPKTMQPELLLSALLNKIPVIIGDPKRVTSPTHALYDATGHDVHAFSEADLMASIYHWCCYTPIKSTDTLFITCHEISEFRLCLLGFLGAISMGTPCVIHQSQALLENLYLEDANVLIASSNQIQMLLENAQFEDLATIRATLSMHATHQLEPQWVAQFKHPLYCFSQQANTLNLDKSTT